MSQFMNPPPKSHKGFGHKILICTTVGSQRGAATDTILRS